MSTRWFVLNVNPEPWRVGPLGVHRVGQKLGAHMGRDQQLDAFKEAVREEIGTGHPLVTGKVKLRFYFWRNRAEYKTQRERTHRKHEADVTNMQKATEDALQSVLFVNDRDVNDIRSVLVEQGPDVRGKIVIGIEESRDLPDAAAELPTEVCELLDSIDEVEPKSTDPLDWGDEKEVF